MPTIASVQSSSTSRVGTFTFDASDPESAYGGLVDTLAEEVTRDFRITWEQP